MIEDEGIRVVLADDQVLFVEMLEFLLENSAPDITVVGTANNGANAVQAVQELRPDVVLMDVRMSGMDGIEATRRIKQELPHTQVMMLTTFDDDVYVKDSIQYGAAGYVLKNTNREELIACIRALCRGSIQISPSVARRLVQARADAVGSAEDADAFRQRVRSLSQREHEILAYIYQAYSNREISEKLSISEQTVKNYISIVYSKLSVEGRFQLIRLLKEHNYPNGF